MSAKKTSPKAKYRVAIIGAGRIAALFDSPAHKEILTHAHAVTTNKRLSLAGFYDVNTAAGRAAAARWESSYYPTLTKLFSECQPDIVVVATPDATHRAVLAEISEFGPRLVIAEKPLAPNSVDAKKIVQLFTKKKIPLIVNYSRRFDDHIAQLRHDLMRGVYGSVLSAQAVYTKGLYHSGSHVIDLMRYLCGEVQSAKPLFKRYDYTPNDPSVAGFLQFERCPSFMLSVSDDTAYGMLEITLYTSNGRITLADFSHQLVIESVVEDRRYKGFFGLGKPIIKKTNFPFALKNLMTHAVAFLDGHEPLKSDGANALKSQLVCAQLSK